jgi:hypothetical protein
VEQAFDLVGFAPSGLQEDLGLQPQHFCERPPFAGFGGDRRACSTEGGVSAPVGRVSFSFERYKNRQPKPVTISSSPVTRRLNHRASTCYRQVGITKSRHSEVREKRSLASERGDSPEVAVISDDRLTSKPVRLIGF